VSVAAWAPPGLLKGFDHRDHRALKEDHKKKSFLVSSFVSLVAFYVARDLKGER
jgi:hypothetical protein